MGLLHNTVIQSAMLGRRMTGIEPQLPLAGLARAERRNWFLGWHAPEEKSGTPDGVREPAAWTLAQRSGGMAARSTVEGDGLLSAAAAGGLNGAATLTGAGDIVSALGQLIVSLAATLEGAGTVASADMRAFLNAAATLLGAGTIATATPRGVGHMGAGVAGAGTVSGATPRAVGELAATIRGYGELTPEGIRDRVWGATATAFNDAGTMGNKLNSAASAGDPWTSSLPGAYPPGSAGYIIGTFLDQAVSAGGLSPTQAAQLEDLAKVHGLVAGVPLVVSPTQRSAGDVVQTIGQAGATTTVTRT